MTMLRRSVIKEKAQVMVKSASRPSWPICADASMGCHEHHASNFIRGIELSFCESLMKWLLSWVSARGLSLLGDRVP